MRDDIFTAKSIRFKKLRLLIAGALVFAFFAAVVGRLGYVQLYDYGRYTEYSKNMYVSKVTFSPTRGRILDRNLTPLALSVPMKSVFAQPSAVKDKRTAAILLGRDLGVSPDYVHQKLDRRGHFAWLKRKVGDDAYEAVKARHIKGVSFVSEDQRFYPQQTLAGRVVGFCGLDNDGLAGLEYLYEKTLSGEQMTLVAHRDATGRIYGYNGEKRPDSNFDLVTTIDSNIQYIAEKTVKAAYDKYEAKAALAVVMDVENGEVLAMAEQPELNLNDPQAHLARHRALSVTQTYEPGSIFKVFVAAAAINDGLTAPNELYDCEKGRYEVYDRVIREANNNKYGVMPLRDVIAKSSNIGMIKLAGKMGPKRMHEYLRKFGFGEKTMIDLPGEVDGLLRDYRRWSGVSLAAISFGQEVMTTPIQIAAALAVIGNGGYGVRPHFMRQMLRDGRVVMEYRPPPRVQVIGSSAARQTLDMMHYTVTDGTGKLAQVPGFEIAGKTGTAQKFDREKGHYSTEKPLSSFIALFPVKKPRYAVLIMVDEPKGTGWGGEVAAPMARNIISGMALYLGLPAHGQRRYEVEWGGVRRALAARPADGGYSLPPVTMPETGAAPAAKAETGSAGERGVL